MVSSSALLTSGALTKGPEDAQGYVSKPKIKYKKLLCGLGIAEIILGICIVVSCVTSLINWKTPPFWYDFNPTYVVVGIACGMFPIICGSVGVYLKRNPTYHMQIVNMLSSAISMVMMLVLLILSNMTEAEIYADLLAIHFLVMGSSFVLLGLNFAHFVYCFTPVCCCRESPSVQAVGKDTEFVENTDFHPSSNNKDAQLGKLQYYSLQIETMMSEDSSVANVK